MNFFKRLYYRYQFHRHAAKALNSRVEVEQYLLNVANNKIDPPTREDCRKLALKLGVYRSGYL